MSSSILAIMSIAKEPVAVKQDASAVVSVALGGYSKGRQTRFAPQNNGKPSGIPSIVLCQAIG